MSISNSDLGFLLGEPAPTPPPVTAAPIRTAPAGPVEEAPTTGVDGYVQPLSERVREAGKRAGIDTDKLGIDISEFDYIMGKPDLAIGPPPENFSDVIKGGSSTAATITSGGAFPKPESLDPHKQDFLDNIFGSDDSLVKNVAGGVVELGKGLVTDVLDGISGYVDAFPTAFNQGVVANEISATIDAIKLNPNDLAARAQLKSLRERADALEKRQLDNFWDIGTGAVVFVPFGGPVNLAAKGLEKIGAEVAGKAITEALGKRGIQGTVIRLVDRAGKGAAMGGAYGYFSTQGDLEASKKSAEMMGALFGAGPAIAAPLKGAFGVLGKGVGRSVNMFNQLPAIASVRKAIYDGPIGRNWDYLATRSEKVFEDFKLNGLLTNMHVARIEASRISGKWVAGMQKNFAPHTSMEAKEHISALMERRMTPTALIAKLGKDAAAPLIRAAASEQRRLKETGRLLQAWGIPMHNSATGDLYNFVMKKNFMPHIIVNPEKLVTDPKLRAQSIAAIAKKTGKSLAEAEADFMQWAERAKFDAANEATSGTIGRATMEARLYGLPGYSMDLPNVLNLYYQKAGRLLAFHRRLGRHVPEVNAWGGGDDAAAIAGQGVPDVTPPAGKGSGRFTFKKGTDTGEAGFGDQMELFAPEGTPPGQLASGSKVIVEGKNGPMKATVVNPNANNKGQVRVRVGKGKGSKLLTVSGSKVRQEPIVQKPEALKGLKKGSDATLKGEPVKVKQTTRSKVIVEKPNGKTVEVPKNSPSLEKAVPRTTLPKMAAAAVKLEDGTIETGAFHGEIYDRIGDSVGENPIDGFVDAAGKFYTRKQAALGDLPKSEMRQELKRLGYTAKEIGAIIKGMADNETLPIEPQDIPDPTQYVPPPPRRVAAKQPGGLGDLKREAAVDDAYGRAFDKADAERLAKLSPEMQADVSAAMYRGASFKEALVEARKGVRRVTGRTPKEVAGKPYQKPTVEKPGRKEAVAKNEGEDLVRNEKLRGVNLTDAEEKVLKRMTDAGMSKQDALDIMFKSGKRKAGQARPTSRNTVKREIKAKKKAG